MDSSSELKPLNNEKELDQAWLEKLLSQKLESPVTVSSWRAVSPESREGFLSEIAYVQVKYACKDVKETESHLVFKFLPEDVEKRQAVVGLGFARRELDFYKLIRRSDFLDICLKAGVNLPVPDCYFSDGNDECITLVMEDLKVDNFKTLIIKEGSTLAQTKVALKTIAVIHAVGYLYLRLPGARENVGILSQEHPPDVPEAFFPQNLQLLIDMYDGTSTGESLKALMPITKEIYRYMQSQKLFDTLVHGDFWAGQVLYSADNNKAIALDWQLSYIGNPVHDLMAMFLMSCDVQILEENLEEILKEYWCAFTEVLKTSEVETEVTFDQLVASVEDLWVSGFLILTCSLQDFVPNETVSDGRLKRAIKFLEERGMFSKLVNVLGDQQEGC